MDAHLLSLLGWHQWDVVPSVFAWQEWSAGRALLQCSGHGRCVLLDNDPGLQPLPCKLSFQGEFLMCVVVFGYRKDYLL